mgnify:CR=1 FL=1
MPVIVRNLGADAATIIMVDSNLQRGNILPSERAQAYGCPYGIITTNRKSPIYQGFEGFPSAF